MGDIEESGDLEPQFLSKRFDDTGMGDGMEDIDDL